MPCSGRRVLAAAAAALFLPALAAAQTAPVSVSAGENGVTVQSQNGDYQLRFGALVNADARFAIDDDSSQVVNSFTIRRLNAGCDTCSASSSLRKLPSSATGRNAWRSLRLKLGAVVSLRSHPVHSCPIIAGEGRF